MRTLSLLFFMVCIMPTVYAQVGVETDTPTETLHVMGEVRVENLPENGDTNAIYTEPAGTKSSTKDQTFNATKTIVADDNGVLGVVNSLPSDVKFQTNCYSSTSDNFSEVNNTYVAQIDFEDFSFVYRPVSSGSNNFIFIRNNTSTDLRGRFVGTQRRRPSSYYNLPINTWVRMSDEIDWDSEDNGFIRVFTDIVGNGAVNTDPHFYIVNYFTQKQSIGSYPSMCLSIEELK